MGLQLPNTLKMMQLNAENLFVFIDHEPQKPVEDLTEKEWKALSSATTQNKSLLKCKWLAESIMDNDPDIIFLNEVGGTESIHNFNKYFLKDTYVPYLIEGNSDRGIDIGYLVHRRLPYHFELITHKDRPLNFLYPHERQMEIGSSNAPKSHYFSRDCLELRAFAEKSSSTPAFICFLVHLKSKLDPDGIDPHGKDRRAAELKTLVEIYKESKAKFPEVPKVVAGDFNGYAAKNNCNEEFTLLHQETDLAEVFALSGKPVEECYTQIQFQRSGNTYGLHIDYIFLSSEWHKNVIAEDTYVYMYRSDLKVKLPYAATFEQRQHLPSDHYPVVTKIKL